MNAAILILGDSAGIRNAPGDASTFSDIHPDFMFHRTFPVMRDLTDI
jgi:hypothetical protein